MSIVLTARHLKETNRHSLACSSSSSSPNPTLLSPLFIFFLVSSVQVRLMFCSSTCFNDSVFVTSLQKTDPPVSRFDVIQRNGTQASTFSASEGVSLEGQGTYNEWP